MTVERERLRPRVRLWVKLAIFGSVGLLMTHLTQLAVSTHVAGVALEQSQEILGRNVARLVASEAADAVLVDDLSSLAALTKNAVSGHTIAYCFVVRDGRVIASSLSGTTPRALVDAQRPGAFEPVVVVSGSSRYLDLAEPVLDGSVGFVRVGVDLSVVEATEHKMASWLTLLAAAMSVVGVSAAFFVGRSLARPIGELIAVANRFDPSSDAPVVASRSNDEIGELTECINRMMVRLRDAHERQLRASEKEGTTERMAALGTLVAGVAHEVNNPLAGMKNCLRRLQRDELGPSSKRLEYLELMEEGLERMESVMQHLLDFARPRPARLEVVAVADVIREGSSLLRPVLARRRVGLREEAKDEHVVADSKQAGQALLNLLLNAAYVTSDGGELRLRIRRRPGLVGIAVEDDGPGVPVELRERLLDPFFTTKPEGEGTGLGLSVSRSIVEAQGGELSLEFPARGMVATLWLKAAPGTTPAATTGAPR